MEKKRSARAILALVMMVMITITTVFATPSTYVEAASGSVKSVTVTNIPSNTLTLKKGASKVLKTKVVAAKGKVSQKVTFKSSNTKLVTVNAKGKITANKKKTGSATVTITSVANKKKSFKVKVTVGNPVSKVTLNKKNVTLYIGKKTTLKATVSPKNASNKNIVWTSSNDRIVKVNSKGQIKAVAAGKAKITATAKDGSGKRAVCTVVVPDPIVMKNVTIVNPGTINVKLSAAQPLTAENFVVKSKWYEKGTFKRTCIIDSVTTTDNVNYIISLNADTEVYENSYVQITANGLNTTGTQTIEMIFEEAVYQSVVHDDSYSAKVGAAVNYEFSTYSDVTSIDAVPAGLSAEIKRGKLVVSGTPITVGASVSTITREDELGNTSTQSIYWFIYDDTNIVAGTTPTYVLTGKNGTAKISKYYSVYGGSGYCEYTLLDGCGYFGFETNSDGSVSSYRSIVGTAPAGNYNVQVQVRDKATGSVCVASIPIIVGATVNVVGTLYDGSGTVMTGYTSTCAGFAGYSKTGSIISVDFYSQDPSNRFYIPDENIEVKVDGTYSALVPAGTYDIRASVSGETKKLYDVAATNGAVYNIQIPSVYKVSIATDHALYTANTFDSWIDGKGQFVGYADVAYLPAGISTITSKSDVSSGYYENNNGTYEAYKNCSEFYGCADYKSAVEVNVTGSTAVTAPVTVVSEPVTLVADTPLTIPVGFKGIVKFTPAVDGTYYTKNSSVWFDFLETYVSETTGETVVRSNYMHSDYEHAYWSSGNYYYPITLKAGTTYYMNINNTGENVTQYDLFITGTQPAPDPVVTTPDDEE